METTPAPPWLDPAAESIPTFEPTGMRDRTDEAARTSRRLALVEVAGWTSLSLAIAAVVTLVLAYFGSIDGWKAAQMQERDHYPARVVRIDETSSDDDDDGWVKVRFGPDSDHMVWAWVSTGDVDRYEVGSSVTALVDRETGSVTLPGENFTPRWFERLALEGAVAALVLGAFGIFVITRVAPIGRALAESPWRTVRAQWGSARDGETSYTTLFVPEVRRDGAFRVSCAWIVRGVIPDRGWVTLEVAGGERGIAIRNPGRRPPTHARPVRTTVTS